MKHLFIIDPIETLNPAGDTSLAFMDALRVLGSTSCIATLSDLFSRGDTAFAHTQEVEVNLEQSTSPINARTSCYKLGTKSTFALSNFDIIWMRKDPPVDAGFLNATMILDLAESDCLIMNRPSSLRIVNEKMWCLRFPELMPETQVIQKQSDFQSLIEEWEHVVLKPLDGAGGRGIMVLKNGDRNANSAFELLSEDQSKLVMIQRFIPGARKGDKRILLLDGEPIGCMNRLPAEGDHRANMHVGGSVNAIELREEDLTICKTLKPHLRALGLHFVGIDVIGGRLTEVNVTSPTGVQEIRHLNHWSLDESPAYRTVVWAEQTQSRR